MKACANYNLESGKACVLTSKLGRMLASRSFLKKYIYQCLAWFDGFSLVCRFSEISVWKSQDIWSFHGISVFCLQLQKCFRTQTAQGTVERKQSEPKLFFFPHLRNVVSSYSDIQVRVIWLLKRKTNITTCPFLHC